jgi:regulator of protease activity HflC (stomatin/prohibitin superfamily)
VIGLVWVCIGWLPFMGLKILKPQEALVLTLFGKYIGTLKGEGFFYVNPFVQGVNPSAGTAMSTGTDDTTAKPQTRPQMGTQLNMNAVNHKISLKVMTLNNNKQKVNDLLGNPLK